MASADRLRRLTLYGAIYFVEGAMLTFFSSFNVLYLRSFELDYTTIGIVSGIALIPFVLKIFIGLLSDRVNLLGWGHRKPFIVLGVVMQSLAFGLIPAINPASQFGAYVALMVIAALGMSTYDTCTDGLSIDTTPEAERGTVQGIMVGGRAISAIVTASMVGFLANRGQWPLVFFIIAALGILTLVLALMVNEPKERPEGMTYDKRAFRSMLDGGFLLFALLGLIYPLALYSANGMIAPFLNEVLGIRLDAVGRYMSVFGFGTVIGAVIGGPLVSRIGRRNSILAALLLTSFVTAGLAMLSSAGMAWISVALFGLAFGYYETVYFAMAMDFSDPRIAAFAFSILMAVGNFGIGAGQPLAGVLVDTIGFRWMFVVFAVVNLLALPVVFGVFNLKKELAGGEQLISG